jgi:hypothetical protein
MSTKGNAGWAGLTGVLDKSLGIIEEDGVGEIMSGIR